jgi:hypothetical protein
MTMKNMIDVIGDLRQGQEIYESVHCQPWKKIKRCKLLQHLRSRHEEGGRWSHETNHSNS